MSGETKKETSTTSFTNLKDSLAVSPWDHHVAPLHMIKPLILAALAATLAFSTGCLSRKSKAKKESSAIASEVEETFRVRWVEKRVGELAAQGAAPEAARAQADREFIERYGFNRSKK